MPKTVAQPISADTHQLPTRPQPSQTGSLKFLTTPQTMQPHPIKMTDTPATIAAGTNALPTTSVIIPPRVRATAQMRLRAAIGVGGSGEPITGLQCSTKACACP